MSKRWLAFKVALYVLCWALSIVMLVTGRRDPIVYAQVIVFPVIAWLSIVRYRRAPAATTEEPK